MTRKEEHSIMKKKLLGLLVATTLIASSAVVASAAEGAICTHGYKPNLAGDGAPYKVTYTHPVCVAYEPDGTPVIVDCTATDTRQNMKKICSNCGEVLETYVDIVSVTHSISH